MRELNQFEPSQKPIQGFRDVSRWFLQNIASIQGDVLVLGDGGLAWVRGSEGWADVECAFRVQPSPGARAAIYLRHTSPGSFVRVTVEDGWARVQERLANRLLGLASAKLPANSVNASSDSEMILRFIVRGRRSWLEADGRTLAGPMPLSRDTAGGHVGLGAEAGTARISFFEAIPSPAYLTFAPSLDAVPDRARPMTHTLVPTWFTKEWPPGISNSQREAVLAAAAEGVTTIPLLDNAVDLSPEDAAEWAASLLKTLASPVLQPLISEVAIRGMNPNLTRSLREAGLRVLHLSPLNKRKHWLRVKISKRNCDRIVSCSTFPGRL